MWKRLDEKYGLPSKLVDVVVYDIKNIKHLQEGDDQSFLELINTVEKGYQDLARINMESEISNSGIVSLIEERLPRDIKREWSREVNRSTSKVEQKKQVPVSSPIPSRGKKDHRIRVIRAEDWRGSCSQRSCPCD